MEWYKSCSEREFTFFQRDISGSCIFDINPWKILSSIRNNSNLMKNERIFRGIRFFQILLSDIFPLLQNINVTGNYIRFKLIWNTKCKEIVTWIISDSSRVFSKRGWSISKIPIVRKILSFTPLAWQINTACSWRTKNHSIVHRNHLWEHSIIDYLCFWGFSDVWICSASRSYRRKWSRKRVFLYFRACSCFLMKKDNIYLSRTN